MKIGILTGGGDVPGLNPAIRAVTVRAAKEGHSVLGIRRGWRGLLNLDTEDPASLEKFTLKLTPDNTRKIERTGGTFLHTSRVNPIAVPAEEVPWFIAEGDRLKAKEGHFDCTPHIIKNLERLGVDVLVPIGGEDTLGYASHLHRQGFPLVSIPKTMDNDVYGTDFCIGFSTAVTRSVEYISQLRTSAGSHERIGVVELFGRSSGETSLISAYLAGVDRAIISEVPFNTERLAGLLMEDKRANPSNYCMMTISEGASEMGGAVIERGQADAFGHRKLGGVGQETAAMIEELAGEKTLFQSLGYLMRSGTPDGLDTMVAKTFANCALDLIGAGTFGRMVALREGRYTHVDGDMPLMGVKKVDVEALYDSDNYFPRVRHGLGLPMFMY
ncbi:MAG: phosphofructokinase [Deltaproteobacteria bacterium]|nr:MAG: phosphofructokinase [Deltaproteobacteria bacterium]